MLPFLDRFRSYEPITFSRPGSPHVSIIVITYNKWKYTYECLKSLHETVSKIPYELIIVDNASSDGTPERLSLFEGAIIMRNNTNTGFIRACNQAAGRANGMYLYFLNNDTILHEDTLAALLRRMESDSHIGAVGSKIIFANNKLQEAGSMLWKDGSATGYGRGDNPHLSQYTFARPVDFCSGASLLVRKSIYDECGGFDLRYEPAYYEEADLCMKIWDKAKTVMYEPESVITHREYGSSTPAQAVEMMKQNHSRLHERWKDDLAHRPMPSDPLASLYNRDRRNGHRIALVDVLPEVREHIHQFMTHARHHRFTLFTDHIPQSVQQHLQYAQIEVQPLNAMTSFRTKKETYFTDVFCLPTMIPQDRDVRKHLEVYTSVTDLFADLR